MTKSCQNCIFHGPPVSLTVPKSRPCIKCIQKNAFPEWKLTDKQTEIEKYNLKRKDYPFPVDDEELKKILYYRTGVCQGCEWHPNVCDYCLRSTIPDFDQPPTKKE